MRLKRPKIITPTLDKGVIKEMFVVTKSRFQVLMCPDDTHCRSDTQHNNTIGNYTDTIGDSVGNIKRHPRMVIPCLLVAGSLHNSVQYVHNVVREIKQYDHDAQFIALRRQCNVNCG